MTHPILLQTRDYSLATVFDELYSLEDRLIRFITEKQLHEMTLQSEFDKESPVIIIPVYKTEADKENNQVIHMIFINNGQVFFTKGDILANFKLDHPKYFWNFKLTNKQADEQDPKFCENVSFSNNPQARQDWKATLYYDAIFDAFGLDGTDDMASFAGFFLVR